MDKMEEGWSREEGLEGRLDKMKERVRKIQLRKDKGGKRKKIG